MSQFFSSQRLQRVMLNDLLRVFKTVLGAALAQLGITAIVYLTNFEPGGELTVEPDNQKLFGMYLLIGGLIHTSMSFQDMHHPLERYRVLMLPVSNFERYLSRYLLTGPLFVIYVLVAFTIMDWAGNLLTEAIKETREPLFEQFSQTTRWTIYTYLGLHAVMFTGAICFRSHALIKTTLATLVVCAGVPASVYIALRIFYFDAFSWSGFGATGPLNVMLAPAFEARWMNVSVVVLFALWILYVAYRCLRAHEVQE